MKQFKFHMLCLMVVLTILSCSKSNPGTDENVVLQSSTNVAQEVKTGTPNCIEPIQGVLKLKAVRDTSSASSVTIVSRTEKLYPSGGYILVFELTRTSNKITLDYKQVHTACGNPAATAFLPATSAPVITNLAAGTYPIEIKVAGVVNQGSLNIPASGTPTLTMQTTNSIIIE